MSARVHMPALVLGLCLTAAEAAAQQLVPVEMLRALLVAAIDAPDGRAHGILAGDMADAITRRFGASAPVHIDVRTERRYTQAGCSRLQVRFSQDGVQLPGSTPARRQTVDIGINYCRDGLPPKSPS